MSHSRFGSHNPGSAYRGCLAPGHNHTGCHRPANHRSYPGCSCPGFGMYHPSCPGFGCYSYLNHNLHVCHIHPGFRNSPGLNPHSSSGYHSCHSCHHPAGSSFLPDFGKSHNHHGCHSCRRHYKNLRPGCHSRKNKRHNFRNHFGCRNSGHNFPGFEHWFRTFLKQKICRFCLP